MSNQAEQSKQDHPQPEQGPDVTITVDNKPVVIHRGHQSVAIIKEKGGVPAAYVLVQDIDGQLKPLDDDGAVTIHGHEVFESHPRDGGSS